MQNDHSHTHISSQGFSLFLHPKVSGNPVEFSTVGVHVRVFCSSNHSCKLFQQGKFSIFIMMERSSNIHHKALLSSLRFLSCFTVFGPTPRSDGVMGCYSRWSMPYVLLLKVPEHALWPMLQFKLQTAHQFCFVVWFSFFLRVLGFPLFHGCWWFLVFQLDVKSAVPYSQG